MSPTLKGARPVLIEGQTVEDFIKSFVRNLQRSITGSATRCAANTYGNVFISTT
jgi:hypothetical protein